MYKYEYEIYLIAQPTDLLNVQTIIFQIMDVCYI